MSGIAVFDHAMDAGSERPFVDSVFLVNSGVDRRPPNRSSFVFVARSANG